MGNMPGIELYPIAKQDNQDKTTLEQFVDQPIPIPKKVLSSTEKKWFIESKRRINEGRQVAFQMIKVARCRLRDSIQDRLNSITCPDRKLTFLMALTIHGEEESVQACLAQPDLRINDVDSVGQTALHKACYLGKNNMVKILLSHPQIDINVGDQTGYTPLMLALVTGQPKCVEELVKMPDTELFPLVHTISMEQFFAEHGAHRSKDRNERLEQAWSDRRPRAILVLRSAQENWLREKKKLDIKKQQKKEKAMKYERALKEQQNLEDKKKMDKISRTRHEEKKRADKEERVKEERIRAEEKRKMIKENAQQEEEMNK